MQTSALAADRLLHDGRCWHTCHPGPGLIGAAGHTCNSTGHSSSLLSWHSADTSLYDLAYQTIQPVAGSPCQVTATRAGHKCRHYVSSTTVPVEAPYWHKVLHTAAPYALPVSHSVSNCFVCRDLTQHLHNPQLAALRATRHVLQQVDGLHDSSKCQHVHRVKCAVTPNSRPPRAELRLSQ